MELKPVKNYKKPNYAVKTAAAVMALATLSGCGSPQLIGLDPVKTEEVELSGTVPPVSEKPEPAETLGLNVTTENSDTADIAGSIAVVPETELILEGETSVIDEPAVTTLLPPDTQPAEDPDERIIELEGDVAFVTEAPDVTTSKAFDPSVDLEGGAPVETESLGRKIVNGIKDVLVALGTTKKVDNDDEIVELEGDVAFTPDGNDDEYYDDTNIENKELEEPVLMGIVAVPNDPDNDPKGDGQ